MKMFMNKLWHMQHRSLIGGCFRPRNGSLWCVIFYCNMFWWWLSLFQGIKVGLLDRKSASRIPEFELGKLLMNSYFMDCEISLLVGKNISCVFWEKISLPSTKETVLAKLLKLWWIKHLGGFKSQIVKGTRWET